MCVHIYIQCFICKISVDRTIVWPTVSYIVLRDPSHWVNGLVNIFTRHGEGGCQQNCHAPHLIFYYLFYFILPFFLLFVFFSTGTCVSSKKFPKNQGGAEFKSVAMQIKPCYIYIYIYIYIYMY